MKTGPQVVRRNANDLRSIATDKAFHNWHTKYEFYALEVGHSSYSVIEAAHDR